MHKQVKQRGNVLFLILLGVVLFAALSYAVTQSFGDGNSALSKSSLKAYANDVIFSGASMEKAVNKMISKGISENRISFTRSSGDGYELTPASSASEHVFNVAGGGANYLDPPADVLDSAHSSEPDFGEWIFTGYNSVDGIGSNASIIAILPFVRADVCRYINDSVSITNPADVPPQDISEMNIEEKYIGSFDDTDEIQVTGDHMRGQKTGCIRGNLDQDANDISDQYFFYYVLYAR